MALSVGALPVDEVIPELIKALEHHQGAALVAPPGSGKTTRVPVALLERDAYEGKLLLLQPRRVAARSCAQWIAKQRGTRLGDEVGYQVRHERVNGPATRIEVITEGLLVQRLINDPELTGVGAVILDEFHERSVALDVSLMMLIEARLLSRPDLKIIVMSATMEAQRVCEALEAPLVNASGRCFPVEVSYLDRPLRAYDPATLAEAVTREVTREIKQESKRGINHCLVFLPGRREIEEVEQRLRRAAPKIPVTPLYGALSSEAQARALDPSGPSRVILATNIAETSLTIDGVTHVVDAGLRRHLKRHPATGLLGLVTSPIAHDSATQRAGRAGRTRAGSCLRLWTEHEHRQRLTETPAELHEASLTATLLQVAAWSGDWQSFEWFERPHERELERAERELSEIGALHEGRVTALGELLAGIPAHPTEALALLWARELNCVDEVASLCALSAAPRDLLMLPVGASRAHDPWLRVEALNDLRRGRRWPELNESSAREVKLSADQLKRRAHKLPRAHHVETRRETLKRALGVDLMTLELSERVGLCFAQSAPRRLGKLRARSADQPRLIYHLVGRGEASLNRSGVLDRSELIIALSARVDLREEPVIELALPVERAWVTPEQDTALHFDEDRGGVYSVKRFSLGALTFERNQSPASSEGDEGLAAEALLCEHLKRDPWRWLTPEPVAQRWLERSRWLAARVEQSATQAEAGSRGLHATLDPPRWDPPLTSDNEPLAQLIESVILSSRKSKRGSSKGKARGDAGRQIQHVTHVTHVKALTGSPLLPLMTGLAPLEWSRALELYTPESYTLPTGQRVNVRYEPNHPPVIRAPVQAFFGEESHPSLGDPRDPSALIPLQLELLAPNRRVAQITSDLPEFWRNSYPDVRRDLRGRYPKHHWPEDPLSIGPQRGSKRRSRK